MKTRTVGPVGRTTLDRSKLTTTLAAVVPAPRLALMPAKGGDHAAIHRLLLAAFHGPSVLEFQAQLDEPGYDPADRLIIKEGERIAAHVRAARRDVQFGLATLPAVRWMDLATLPEYRGRGFATSLIAAAERRARQGGAVLGLTRTRVPSVFSRQGWAVCGRHVYSIAGARQVLAQLQSTAEGLVKPPGDHDQSPHFARSKPTPLHIRPLRRIELSAIGGLYDQTRPGRFGSLVRSEAYWEWLLGRGAYDRIYVASESPDSADLAQLQAGVRGYVCVKEGRIAELIAAAGRRDVAEELAARVCADASEQNQWEVRLDAPPDDLLHGLFDAAGGQVHQAEELGGEVFMAKVFDPAGLLAALADSLAIRLEQAGLPRTAELTIEIQHAAQPRRSHAADVERLTLAITSRGTKISTGQSAKHSLSLRGRDLAPLVLGHWNLLDMIESGRIRASSKAARQLGSVLFPKLPWWRPPLDDLLA